MTTLRWSRWRASPSKQSTLSFSSAVLNMHKQGWYYQIFLNVSEKTSNIYIYFSFSCANTHKLVVTNPLVPQKIIKGQQSGVSSGPSSHVLCVHLSGQLTCARVFVCACLQALMSVKWSWEGKLISQYVDRWLERAESCSINGCDEFTGHLGTLPPPYLTPAN